MDMHLSIKSGNPIDTAPDGRRGDEVGRTVRNSTYHFMPRAVQNCSRTDEVPEERFAGRIRKEQLGAVLRLTPPMMLANVASGSTLVFAFWQSDERGFLLAWLLTLSLAVAIGLRAWFVRGRRSAPKTVSARGLHRTTLHAFTLGAIWSAAPVVLFDGADAPQRMLLAALVTGMIAGGGFTLSTLPAAALAYCSSITVTSMGVLLASGEPIHLMLAAPLLAYVLIIMRGVHWNAEMFVERLKNQFDLEEQRELVGILLRDFEENASDWLWETDADGRLQRISPRFAEVTGRSEGALQGRRLVDLLRPVDRQGRGGHGLPDDRDLLDDLLGCMDERLAFRDRTVHVQVGRDRRFWSLSAKPVHDADGGFKGYRGVGTDVTEKIRAERKLAYLAHVDPMTDLANRSSLESRLARAFRDLRSEDRDFCLICLDLDGFKAVNDSYGHAAGDRLLAMVARRLRRCVRDGDMVARIGGDEFAILQNADEQPKAGMILAERIVATLSSPFELQGRQVTLGASVGIAKGGRDGSNPMSLLRHADLALYRAKHSGRGRYLLYQPRMAMDAKKAAPSLPRAACRERRNVERRTPEPASSLG